MERFPRSESYKGNRRTRSGQIRSRPFPLSGQIHARCRTVPLRPLLRKQRYAPLSDRAISTVRSGEAFPKAPAYPEPPFCGISLMPTRPGSYRPHTGRCIISDSICSAICSAADETSAGHDGPKDRASSGPCCPKDRPSACRARARIRVPVPGRPPARPTGPNCCDRPGYPAEATSCTPRPRGCRQVPRQRYGGR